MIKKINTNETIYLSKSIKIYLSKFIHSRNCNKLKINKLLTKFLFKYKSMKLLILTFWLDSKNKEKYVFVYTIKLSKINYVLPSGYGYIR